MLAVLMLAAGSRIFIFFPVLVAVFCTRVCCLLAITSEKYILSQLVFINDKNNFTKNNLNDALDVALTENPEPHLCEGQRSCERWQTLAGLSQLTVS